jgi:hypothetical protein
MISTERSCFLCLMGGKNNDANDLMGHPSRRFFTPLLIKQNEKDLKNENLKFSEVPTDS